MQIKRDFMSNHSPFVSVSFQQHDSRHGMQIHVAVTLLECCQQTNLTHLENKGWKIELPFHLFILQRRGNSKGGKDGLEGKLTKVIFLGCKLKIFGVIWRDLVKDVVFSCQLKIH